MIFYRFGFYELGQSDKIISFDATKLYLEDWIGLKTLNEEGKLDFILSEGDHLQHTEQFFSKIVEKYLIN